jgi:hypothetical protein
MSASGTKRTSNCRPAMSAFGGKADIEISGRDVCFRPKADIDQTAQVACGQSLLYHAAANPNVCFWHKARSTDSPLGRLDRVVSQPHLTLRPEHVQKHGDVLARHSGTKSGATREQAGNNPHAVTSLEAALLREVNRTVALAPADGGDHLVRHMGRLVPALDQTDHSRTPANVVPLQLDAASSGRKSKTSSTNSKRLAGSYGRRDPCGRSRHIGRLIRKCIAGSPNARHRKPSNESAIARLLQEMFGTQMKRDDQ